MNEITRIHIAKTPYDIEIQAKKDLETYIKKLELYSDDSNLLEDIEIRMTELLAERNVKKNDLISSNDINALKEILGEPKEFWGEGDIAIGPDEDDKPRRRLYRDLQGAALGGVLSGIAKYLDISALWTRIAFLIIVALSFGTALFVYAVLWIIIPPARTAAEKLESAGRPITLASIKTLNERDDIENRIAPMMQAVLRIGAGTLLILAALGALTATGLGIYEFTSYIWWFGPHSNIFLIPTTWLDWLAVGLLGVAGLLLATLFILLAVAIFKKKWVKRTTIAAIVIVAVGLLSFGSGAGILTYQSWQQSVKMDNSRTVTNVPLPASFKSVKVLNSDAIINNGPDNIMPVMVHYIVSSGSPRYEMASGSNSVEPVIKLDGNHATITISAKNDPSTFYVQPTLTIYGPALDVVIVNSSTFEYYNKDFQNTLTVSTLSHHVADNNPNGINDMSGSFSLKGSYGMVTSSVEQGSSALLNQASIRDLNANLTSGYLNAGVVRTLHANVPDVCAAEDSSNSFSMNRMAINGVSTGSITYNGTEKKAETISNPCGLLIIGSEQEFDQSQNY